MTRHLFAVAALVAATLFISAAAARAQQPHAAQGGSGQSWVTGYNHNDWNRLYHYPYVWYPQNFYADGYYQSANDMYYRYPQEMRIPVYNRAWQNYYPKDRRYHQGHHFNLDVF